MSRGSARAGDRAVQASPVTLQASTVRRDASGSPTGSAGMFSSGINVRRSSKAPAKDLTVPSARGLFKARMETMVILKKHFLVIAGCGPESSDFITPEVRAAAEWAEVLVGTQRLLDLFPESSAEKIAEGFSVENVLQEIETRRAIKRIVVLVTGDPVLNNLAEQVIRRFGRETCRLIPGENPTQAAENGAPAE